jgi:hypothetical protein
MIIRDKGFNLDEGKGNFSRPGRERRRAGDRHEPIERSRMVKAALSGEGEEPFFRGKVRFPGGRASMPLAVP